MTSERWHTFPLRVQLGHIGSELSRAKVWEDRGDIESSKHALERAMELISLSLCDPHHRNRFSEIARLYEVIGNHYISSKKYNVGLDELVSYCNQYTLIRH